MAIDSTLVYYLNILLLVFSVLSDKDQEWYVKYLLGEHLY